MVAMRREVRSVYSNPLWVCCVLSVLVLIDASSLDAQTRPGPRRGGTSSGRSSGIAGSGELGPPIAQLPMVSYEGKLREISDKTIILELDDSRPFTFKRSGGTRFFKDSHEVKASDLSPGDRVAVNANQDGHGFLVAEKVTFQAVESAEQPVQPPSPPEPEPVSEPGPVLHRASSARAPEPLAVDETERHSSTPLSTADQGGEAAEDPLIEKAREAALSFSDTLPNFICQENMARFSRDLRGLGWQPLDAVSAEVIYEDGQESYRNLKVNDQPTNKKMEELSGSWSTGEFATTLRNLFHPATAAEFEYGEESKILGLPARVYDFQVRQENSHWTIQMDSKAVTPAYKGSVWIEPQSGRVLRIEIQAMNLPLDFPMDQVESTVDYSFVSIGTGAESVLLPVHAETLGCQRGSNACSRNIIDFRNYRKYVADSKIRFDP